MHSLLCAACTTDDTLFDNAQSVAPQCTVRSSAVNTLSVLSSHREHSVS